MAYKYEYQGENPLLLIEYHKEVAKGDVIELDQPIDNVFFVLVQDEPQETVQESKKKPKGEVDQ